MKTKSKFPEDIIYKIWEEKRFNLPLKTSEGFPVDIMDPGVRNNEVAGPDYQHARIKIGNITFTGDVEIDTVPPIGNHMDIILMKGIIKLYFM
ncbi:MAG: DUF2851 family protein [Ignavibacterium sp.]|nr:DUF2851 family protein [Ignavibacterium sp.]